MNRGAGTRPGHRGRPASAADSATRGGGGGGGGALAGRAAGAVTVRGGRAPSRCCAPLSRDARPARPSRPWPIRPPRDTTSSPLTFNTILSNGERFLNISSYRYGRRDGVTLDMSVVSHTRAVAFHSSRIDRKGSGGEYVFEGVAGCRAPRDEGLVGTRCRLADGRNAFAKVEQRPEVPSRFSPGPATCNLNVDLYTIK